jgi:hypothetical protein
MLPVVFYGAPAYAFISHKGILSWPVVVLGGIAPGASLFLYERDLSLWFMICGVAIACITHFLSNQGRDWFYEHPNRYDDCP